MTASPTYVERHNAAMGVEAQRILFERLTGYQNKLGQQSGIPV